MSTSILVIIFGTLFAVLIMSYFGSEKAKKKATKQVVDTPPIGDVEPPVKLKLEAVPTTQARIDDSNRKLNQVLKNSVQSKKYADDQRVLRGFMTEEEYNKKWNHQQVS